MVLSLSGLLDQEQAAGLQDLLKREVAHRVVLDLSEVTARRSRWSALPGSDRRHWRRAVELSRVRAQLDQSGVDPMTHRCAGLMVSR